MSYLMFFEEIFFFILSRIADLGDKIKSLFRRCWKAAWDTRLCTLIQTLLAYQKAIFFRAFFDWFFLQHFKYNSILS